MVHTFVIYRRTGELAIAPKSLGKRTDYLENLIAIVASVHGIGCMLRPLQSLNFTSEVMLKGETKDRFSEPFRLVRKS